MTFVVPFDGTQEGLMGLRRAVELAPTSVRVVVFSVVPRANEDWARDRDLLEADEEYSTELVISRLQDLAHEVSDAVTCQHTTVDRYAPTGKISHEIRAFARDVYATMVFVGSLEAGGIVNRLQSVGTHVASDEAYDVVFVRHVGSVFD